MSREPHGSNIVFISPLIALIVLVLVIPLVYFISISFGGPLSYGNSTYTGTLQTICCGDVNPISVTLLAETVGGSGIIIGALALYFRLAPYRSPFAEFWDRIEKGP